MKRTGNLINNISELNNLQLAFWKSQRGKQSREEVINYRNNLQTNLLYLRKQILSGSIDVGNYHYFTIHDPKERTICAASFPERVLHHALINVCHPVFEKHQIYHSYATRIGKGTYKALARAKENQNKYKFYLKLDVRKYFDSISHKILYSKLETILKDPMLLYIFYQIIDSYRSNLSDTFKVSDRLGLPIGNLSSQYFANHYLASADHYIKNTLRIKGYVRYMDDMILWHNNKNELLQAGNKILKYLENILKLDLKIFSLNKSIYGVNFVGYQIFPNKILLSKRSKKRFTHKYKEYTYKLNSGEWSEAEYQNHILPLFAFTQHAYTKQFRKQILEKRK